MKCALTIAGSDSSGGAGIQADLKTFTALGVYGMSVVTAVTAQNTLKVSKVQYIEKEMVKAQMDAVFSDIRPDSVKIGMTCSESIICQIAESLDFYAAKNIVFDPVMVSSSGTRLLEPDAVLSLQKNLFPLSDLVTPNIPEAEIISGICIKSKYAMETAAMKIIEKSHCSAVLVKGGHMSEDSSDFYFDGKKGVWFTGEKILNPNTHGTGCTLSSAISANLALGNDMESSIRNAKEYLNGALRAMLDLGKGSGPLNHIWNMN